MKLFSLGTLLTCLAVLYLASSISSLYSLWNPEECVLSKREQYCYHSIIHQKPILKWKIKIYSTHLSRGDFDPNKSTLVTSWNKFNISEPFKESVNLSLPSSTLTNGSLYLHIFLHPHGESAFSGAKSIHQVIPVTAYKVPVSYFSLVGNKKNVSGSNATETLATTHWYPELSFNILTQDFVFDIQNVPPEFIPYIRTERRRKNYLPILYVNDLYQKHSSLKPLPEGSISMPLEINYDPISVGKLRFWITISHSMTAMKSMGFTDDDTDDIKDIFIGTTLYFLALTMFVSVFHMVFDILAFKNDISYWKKRKNMAGLSFHSVFYRSVSTIIIFLYLFDEKTSLLVLVPAGISAVIELWKVKKALKMKVSFQGWRLKIEFNETTENEKSTQGFDQEALKYLSYLLYPLCIVGAIYSLIYVPHKSVYSWIIKSLVNAVYAFGFLFMLPQLFINYKLKSVAHLPWKVFIYKAFNTFIDDVFAFIIQMPMSHRIACFRDDLVFFCYLYQLWLYPVDKSRVNEFGVSYEDEEEEEKQSELKEKAD